MSWRDSFKSLAERAAVSVEDRADAAWRNLSERLGLNRPRHIAAYRGYSDGETVWVRGRLLANKPVGGPRDDDDWWDNLRATYERWETDEIVDATLTLSYCGRQTEVVTNAEGYYDAELRVDEGSSDADTVEVAHVGDGERLTAQHQILRVRPEAKLLLISDMDDTVIHTGITDLLRAAQLTFLNNAKTRKPLAGVSVLYQAFSAGPQGAGAANPIMYLSNSGWNMYDLLRDFLVLNDLPFGPLLLRDLGLGADSATHKIDSLRTLYQRFAHLPIVLVGDSGQHDAEIYSELAADYPDRTLAIYIRDVDPQSHSQYDQKVQRFVDQGECHQVPLILAKNSTRIARHAAGLGLISAEHVSAVEAESAADRQRERP